jgi:peptidoglycan/xylan/chitin deacetylase (PgdA/CDA1 family)
MTQVNDPDPNPNPANVPTDVPAAGVSTGGASTLRSLADAAAGLAWCSILWPLWFLADGAPTREVVTAWIAVVAGAVVAVVVDRLAGSERTVPVRLSGWVAASAGALCVAVTPAGLSTVILGVLIGAAVGLVAGRPTSAGRPGLVLGGALGVVATVVLFMGPSPDPVVLWFVVLATATPVLASLPGRTARRAGAAGAGRRRRVSVVVVGGAVGLLAWTGANDPQLSWFGPVVAHGPRDVGTVALTFDDGPNVPYSLRIADVLESRGAQGTFFLVGKAIDAEPAAARELMERGHLVGNHSYHHDYWRWLDPGYPELDRTQDAFERHLGVCPALYRPPHGQRTPFVSAQVASEGMRTITWDVSGLDWSLADGDEVARRILARVQPGSIILLHDGLDGFADADRQVVLDALPTILDGLEERGLRPVRVDELVDVPDYLSEC